MLRPDPSPGRLIDLHCDWLLQYACETNVFDPALYRDVPDRIGQTEGYLTGTAAAVLACYRRREDWARQVDPWAALGALITRIEAEFSGRLLIGPDDLERWGDDPDSLCWGVIGIEGFDALIREAADLDRLPALLRRGVRVLQPVYGQESILGGSSEAGDDRGLTDLGRAFLQMLVDVAADGPVPPRPWLDLAHLNPRSMADVLDWFEADPARPERLIPVYSHGAPEHVGFVSPRAITAENLRRLRAVGGWVGFSVGPPFFDSSESIRAAIEAAAALPFRGRPGYEGVCIGTDFLGVDRTLSDLDAVGTVAQWLNRTFPPPVASLLMSGNARTLLASV